MTLLIGLAVLIAYHAIFVAIGFALGRRAERRASAEHATLARGLHGSSDIQAALLREIDTPAFVAIVGRSIAEARGMGPAELAAATWSTTSRFYGLGEAPATEPARLTASGPAPGAPAPGGARSPLAAPGRATPDPG